MQKNHKGQIAKNLQNKSLVLECLTKFEAISNGTKNKNQPTHWKHKRTGWGLGGGSLPKFLKNYVSQAIFQNYLQILGQK